MAYEKADQRFIIYVTKTEKEKLLRVPVDRNYESSSKWARHVLMRVLEETK